MCFLLAFPFSLFPNISFLLPIASTQASLVAREYLEEAAVVFIVEVVFVIVVSLTASRTGGPVREAQRWLPPCHQQRPNAIPFSVICR